MDTPAKNILVPIDFYDLSLMALKQSFNLARLLKLEITLLHVFEESGIFPSLFSSDQHEKVIQIIREKLDEIASKASLESGVKINTAVLKGKAHSKIVEYAVRNNTRIIVMGTSSNDGNKETDMVGANTSRVIRSARCPVITINGMHHHKGCRSILLPLDLKQETRQKVTWAIEIAKHFGSTIKVVSVYWSKNDEEVLSHLNRQIHQVSNFIKESGIPCHTEIVQAENEKGLVGALLDYTGKQKDIDLIMIMTQEETGFIEFFVGSAATEIIRKSAIPVMSIVPKETGLISINA